MPASELRRREAIGAIRGRLEARLDYLASLEIEDELDATHHRGRLHGLREALDVMAEELAAVEKGTEDEPAN